QGQGIGAEAGALTLEFALRELNLHRVSSTVFAYNLPSQALMERLGFRREGAFREFVHRDGARYDMIPSSSCGGHGKRAP
ncbi:MAG: GNAT family N-acetyltransferase, partial [Chloroflexi bacterium]|nr:GNAT family N-acetyltransferase [Chloroflexota bacterium]